MKRYYSRLIEKHSWLLLLLLIIPGLLFNDDDYKIGTYSYLIVIAPVLLYWLLNPAVLTHMFSFRSARLFIPFLVFSTLSIFWSTDGYSTSALVKCLGACVVLTLCYLLTQHQRNRLPLIEHAIMIGGTLCLVLAMHDSGWTFSPHLIAEGYGVFNHHVYISWLAATLLLLLLASHARLSIIQCGLFCFFLGCIILSGGRGGLVVFIVGYLCMIFSQENRYREKQVILCLIIPALLIALFTPTALLNMVNKGTSSRGPIFQIHFKQATDTHQHLLIGRGLNTSTDLIIKKKRIPHFHSLYLTTMYKGGVIGLLLYLIMVGFIAAEGLRKPSSQPWIFIVIGMCVALAVDASDFFVWPSALMTCFIIPLFITLFSSRLNNTTVQRAHNDEASITTPG